MYEGEKKNSLREGQGKFYYKSGGMYIGSWKNNKMEGTGTLYYPNSKKAYEGEWQDGKFHGTGVLFNERPIQLDQAQLDFCLNLEKIAESWERYEGEFRNDFKEGFGRLYFSDGSMFEGNFQGDKIEGKGRFLFQNGEFIDAVWQDNLLKTFLKAKCKRDTLEKLIMNTTNTTENPNNGAYGTYSIKHAIAD